MRSVKLNKNELLTIVRQNKDKHVLQYEESVVDFRTAVIKITTENSKLAKSGSLDKIAKIKTIPSKPVSYEDNYNRAIRMLELSVEETIELEEDIFNQLVLDEWQWKHQFSTSAALYKSFS